MGMLLGLVKPTSGTFTLFGPEVPHQDALHRIGAIVETPSFYPYLSGYNNLAFFQGISGKGSSDELDQLLGKVGLGSRGKDSFKTYSLGMKQRLGLAYALLGSPDVLFLDEPTNGMDPAGMAEVRELIRSLATGGRTILLSSHLLNEVEMVCDSVGILSKGNLIAQGKVADLIQTGEQIRISTTDNAKALEILSGLDWVTEAVSDDQGLLITAPSDRSAELSIALNQFQVYVSSMVTVRTSLEEYFLEVTGDDEEPDK